MMSEWLTVVVNPTRAVPCIYVISVKLEKADLAPAELESGKQEGVWQVAVGKVPPR